MVSLFDILLLYMYTLIIFGPSLLLLAMFVGCSGDGPARIQCMNELSIFRCASISRRALRRSRINGFSNHIICHFSLAWLGIKEPTRPKITATLHARVWRPCFKMFQDGSNTCWNQWSMEELAASKGKDDKEGEGDQEGQFGHPPPTYQFYI